MSEETDNSGGNETEPQLNHQILELLKSVKKSKDQIVWPAVSLLASLRLLHFLALKKKLDIKRGQRILELGLEHPIRYSLLD